MALPVLDYSTWRFKVNQNLDSPGTVLACFQQLLWSIKDSLITASGWTDSAGSGTTLTAPWTVIASSNGTVADASDNWTTSADLVWAATGTAHSWIVLRQTGINGQNFELLLDCNSASNNRLTVSWTPATGFDVSSPSTLTAPTATYQSTLVANSVDWVTTAITFNCALHVQVTDGGECTRVVVYIGGACKAFWALDKPKDAVSGWSSPAIGYLSYSGAPLYTTLNDVTNARCWVGSVETSAYLASAAYGTAMLGQNLTVANEVSGCWPMIPVRVVTDTYPAVGLVGTLRDTWWGATGVADGDTYPDTGTLKQFLHVGNLIIPWNQSTPLLT